MSAPNVTLTPDTSSAPMHILQATLRHGGLALLLGLAFLCSPLATKAQQAAKVWRIAVLTGDRPGAVEALVDGLRELNYVEGQNFVLEIRHYTGNEQLPAVASEVVQLNPDVIVVGGAAPAKALNAKTKTVPIVMAASSDAIAQGVIASLARPGGNITGFTDMDSDLTAKRVELLKQAAPQAGHIAVIGCPDYVAAESYGKGAWSKLQSMAQRAGLTLVPAFVRNADELPGAFASATRQKIDAVLVLECGIMPRADRVTSLVNGSRVPAMYPSPRYTEAGGLMAYGPDTLEQYRRAATFVDKILKGAKPADLPVEQPAKFVLVINLKTAKALGLTMSQALLLRADKVIE
jgi:putative ABC transport system substrate-binding protein